MLIQKDTKLSAIIWYTNICLRALLIQKDTKRESHNTMTFSRLRALLIQKDTKLINAGRTLKIV